MRDWDGFSLVELMIAVAILSIVSVLGWIALQTSTQQTALATAQSAVQQDVRAVAMLIGEELEVASASDRETLDPAVTGVKINAPCKADSGGLVENGGIPCETEVVVEIPPEVDGAPWRKVRIRYVNEDEDSDGELDSGEDLNYDGRLNRGFFRIEDRDGDGSVSQSGDMVLLGATNNIIAGSFTLSVDKQVITVRLTAERTIGGSYVEDEVTGENVPARVQSDLRTDVYMLN